MLARRHLLPYRPSLARGHGRRITRSVHTRLAPGSYMTLCTPRFPTVAGQRPPRFLPTLAGRLPIGLQAIGPTRGRAPIPSVVPRGSRRLTSRTVSTRTETRWRRHAHGRWRPARCTRRMGGDGAGLAARSAWLKPAAQLDWLDVGCGPSPDRRHPRECTRAPSGADLAPSFSLPARRSATRGRRSRSRRTAARDSGLAMCVERSRSELGAISLAAVRWLAPSAGVGAPTGG